MEMACPFVTASLSANGMAVITLDRPKALNAMNLDMDVAYKKHLDEWVSSPAVRGVLVESSSPRAFSAGMDVKGVAAAAQEDRNSPIVAKSFSAEYTLICLIARNHKPYISLMDGITMGFGIGLSGHGRYRIVTEKTVLAMPENGIGLFPDVGFSYLAAKTPGNGAIGAYLALTGARINNPADALYVGLGTHYVPSEKLLQLRESLLKGDLSVDADHTIRSMLSGFAKTPEMEPPLQKLYPSIVSCFGGNQSVLESVEALKKEQCSSHNAVADWAKGTLSGLLKGCPYSLCLTQKHFSKVSSAISSSDNELSQIEGVMKIEYRLALRICRRTDFIEGVRAVLVDKDHKPKWQPATLEDVDQNDIDLCFKPLEDTNELEV